MTPPLRAANSEPVEKEREDFEAWRLRTTKSPKSYNAIAREGMDDDAVYEDRTTRAMWVGWQASRRSGRTWNDAIEAAAVEAASWRGSKLLLHAGEMTEQERRTAEAVANGIAATIRRALKEPEQ